MCRRGENIYKRRDGRWEGRYICGRKKDGQPIFRSVYAQSYMLVRTKLNKARLDENSREEHAHIAAITFEEWSLHWLEQIVQPTIRTTTYLNYKRIIDTHLIPAFGSRTLAAMVREEVQAQLRTWYTKLASSTVQAIFRIFRSIIRQACAQGYCTDFLSGIRVSGKPKTPRVLTLYEQKLLEQRAVGLDRRLILLCLYSGLRLGEVCALRWEDIDWQASTLTIRRSVQRLREQSGTSKLVLTPPKSESSTRTVPLGAALHRELLRTMGDAPCSAYILGTEIRPAEPRTVQQRFARLVRTLGFEGVHVHTLRHTFATRCLEKNINIAVLSALLGHSSPRITLAAYTHCTEQSMRESIELLCEGVL